MADGEIRDFSGFDFDDDEFGDGQSPNESKWWLAAGAQVIVPVLTVAIVFPLWLRVDHLAGVHVFFLMIVTTVIAYPLSLYGFKRDRAKLRNTEWYPTTFYYLMGVPGVGVLFCLTYLVKRYRKTPVGTGSGPVNTVSKEAWQTYWWIGAGSPLLGVAFLLHLRYSGILGNFTGEVVTTLFAMTTIVAPLCLYAERNRSENTVWRPSPLYYTLAIPYLNVPVALVYLGHRYRDTHPEVIEEVLEQNRSADSDE